MSNAKQTLAILGVVTVVVVGFVGALSLFDNNSSGTNDSALGTAASPVPAAVNKSVEFQGDKGATLTAESNAIYISEELVNDGSYHPFNYYSANAEKSIFFFVLRASDGTYRVAANACEVCFDSKKGFRQVGELVRCENCRTTYTKDQIALQRGGCNPVPINRNAPIENGQLVLDVSEIEAVASYF